MFCLYFQVFFNEHRNNWYSSGSYYWSKNLFSLLRFFPTDYIFFFIAYYCMSEPDVFHWTQGFWKIPNRFLQFIIYIFIGNANLHGNAYLYIKLNIHFILFFRTDNYCRCILPEEFKSIEEWTCHCHCYDYSRAHFKWLFCSDL